MKEKRNISLAISRVFGVPTDMLRESSKKKDFEIDSFTSYFPPLIEEPKSAGKSYSTLTNINIEKIPRGFSIFSFKDSYGNMCSIQESSAASEPKIWLGIDNAKITTKDGTPIDSENMTTFSRMHLSQEQVKELLPLLENFARTGSLD